MESLVRLRLVFETRHLLTKTQKSDGLKRSWILLKPELETISDFAAHLTHTFNLHQACPYGLLLSMDGFVLPPFESTRIFKDEDIVRVKRKEGDATRIIGHAANVLENPEVIEKQLVQTGVKLLALEEFEKETGGYQSDPENLLPSENPSNEKVTLKKRKSSTELRSSKRKRVRSPSPEQSPNLSIESVETDGQANNQDLHHDGVLSQKSLYKKEKSSKANAILAKASATDVGNGNEKNVKRKKVRYTSPEKSSKLTTEGVENDGLGKNKDCNHKVSRKSSNKKDKSSKTKEKLRKASNTDAGDGLENSVKFMASEERKGELQEDNMQDLEGIMKRPSRSARRKKAKRKWLREAINSQTKAVSLTYGRVNQTVLLHSNRPEKSIQNECQELQKADQNIEPETEFVPIVVKPGHIRFEPVNEDEVIRQSQDPVGTFLWNGSMSKKKGQKWGMERTSTSKSNAYENSWEDSLENPTVEEEELVQDSVDFEKLKPLTSLPKEGEVVAYKLLELSSSRCPELSEFRVGKTLCYESASNMITLVPVPGFPVVFDDERDGEALDQQSGFSLYKEDGSLEIDFATLVDVRIFNSTNSDPVTVVTDDCMKAASVKDSGSGVRSKHNCEEGTVVTDGGKKAPANNREAASSAISNGNGKPRDIWEEVSQALSEKKSQLLQKDTWGKQEGSERSQWSYKGLRRGALGPTMALLRAGSRS